MLPGETVLSGACLTEGVSVFKVCQSAAGYFVGTTYHDKELGCDFPNTRETCYFSTEKQAQAALDSFLAGNAELDSFLAGNGLIGQRILHAKGR